MNCPTCTNEMTDTDATRDRVVGHEMVRGMRADTCTIDGVLWCSRCGTLVFKDQDGSIAESLVPSSPEERAVMEPESRTCTCLGICRGADGLAPGWHCALSRKVGEP